MKRCSTCKLDKVLEDYNKHCISKDGYRSCCRSCQAKSKKTYLEKNKIKSGLLFKTISYRYRKAQRVAKQRSIPWTLSEIEYEKLISVPCFYCANKLGGKVAYGCGLDRIDCSKGYELENVISCCWKCNTIKSDILSFEETKAVVRLVLKLRNKKDRQHSLATGPKYDMSCIVSGIHDV